MLFARDSARDPTPCTASHLKEHIIAGLEAGADDYLVKPVHEPELVARLNAGRRILALEHSLRGANERNRILSITDALTGAYNRRYLMELLGPSVRKSPFVPASEVTEPTAHLVQPRVVGEVRFSEWTTAGHLRHPVWRGLREDKAPADVVVEA